MSRNLEPLAVDNPASHRYERRDGGPVGDSDVSASVKVVLA